MMGRERWARDGLGTLCKMGPGKVGATESRFDRRVDGNPPFTLCFSTHLGISRCWEGSPFWLDVEKENSCLGTRFHNHWQLLLAAGSKDLGEGRVCVVL